MLAVAGAIRPVALVDSQIVRGQPGSRGSSSSRLLVVWVIYGFWAGWDSWRLAFYFMALLLALTVRSTWQLNQMFGLMQPGGIWPASTSPDMRLLVEDVERLSSAAARRSEPGRASLRL